ncbi:hypothetical protein ncot_08205 [Nocardioides sp. JQ2195]|uniref:hypothetical protein n=1 Tax=Nocardioides sp. JQ2195 TaxID=2592334 RepID=UPI00143EA5F5|nr:hypothetical protein [Nocardioides sp. JQ2195]QIX26586.1 hypothetical protein ncot_08205 [Nocardioides sp. JQ2195]
MASTPVSALAERLDVPVGSVAGLEACSAEELTHLDSLVEAAFVREQEAVEAGLKATLQAVPRPLRGRAKSLLFPGGDA